MSSFSLWSLDDCGSWQDARESYPQVIAAQGSERLVELDGWYRGELPGALAARGEPFVTLEELGRVAAWKMTRGVWRERNRQLIAGNNPGQVREVSRQAFAAAPDPRKPVSLLASLAGVGPATASAALAAYAPHVYPFFDEQVADGIPGLGPVAFTMKYYLVYAERLRERAAQLSSVCEQEWTAQDVAQAMWAASGGKAALHQG